IRAQEARVREAQAQLKQAKAGARPEEIREANAVLAEARADSDAARVARLDLIAMDQRIRAAQAHTDASRQQLNTANVTSGRQQTISPLDGVVTQVLVNPGDGVSEQTPLVIV